MILIILSICIIAWLALCIWSLQTLLRYFQIHEYDNSRFTHWSFQHLSKVFRPVELAIFPVIVLILFFEQKLGQSLALTAFTGILFIGALLLSLFYERKQQTKAIKPLVFTTRVRRIFSATVLVFVIEVLIAGTITGLFAGYRLPGAFDNLWALPVLLILGQFEFLSLVSGNIMLYPIEEGIRKRFISAARRKIDAIQPYVIGITGSYGKTTTKDLLAHILSAKYDVLYVPGSYNTLMGVCKVINEQLRKENRYLIVEMGAYRKGEIAEICKLVKPQIGILTAIGPQHLERFKSIENIIEAKNELILALPADGIAIFNGDDPNCQRLAERAKVRVLRYGLSENKNLDLRARIIEVKETGSSFELMPKGSEAVAGRTRMLGNHNVLNALGAILAARECGMSYKEATAVLASFSPTDHRLKILKGNDGIITIDNTYNSNPLGAAAALSVLGELDCQGNRILVTPGFAELGAIEEKEHELLGQKAAQVCDLVFLIGNQKRVGQILKGLVAMNFDPSHIFTFHSLKEARTKLREIVKPGDILLFENDLPDIYF